MVTMRQFVVLIILIFSSGASSAKESGGGGGSGGTKWQPMIWASLGVGQMKIIKPKYDVNPDGYVSVELGGQDALFLKTKFVQFTMAIFAGLSSGKLNYKYHSEDNVNYTASDVKYSMTNVGTRIGLQFRLVDVGWFRFFVEGGGFFDSTSVNYDTLDTTLKNQGSTYIKSEKDIQGGGWYADSGLDLRVIRYGVRVGARQTNGAMGKLKALDRRKFEYQTTVGYLAVFKDF